MGLAFSHGNAAWAYSGFNRFRLKLAAAIGINLDEMDGFTKAPDYRGKTWRGLKDPIIPLLNHSDCDGVLTPKECKQIAPRLRELIAPWPDFDFDKKKGLELADGMDEAAKAGEKLKFT